jgi:hypothetical protein
MKSLPQSNVNNLYHHHSLDQRVYTCCMNTPRTDLTNSVSLAYFPAHYFSFVINNIV